MHPDLVEWLSAHAPNPDVHAEVICLVPRLRPAAWEALIATGAPHAQLHHIVAHACQTESRRAADLLLADAPDIENLRLAAACAPAPAATRAAWMLLATDPSADYLAAILVLEALPDAPR